jgi:hypothetical protein
LSLVVGCFLFRPNDNENQNQNENQNENENTNDNTTGNSGLTGKYLGSTRCADCHARYHSDWAETLHAGALETLEAIGQGTNPDCLGCHTVGYGEEGGFVDRATTNDLAGVGCEACHGGARDHVMNISDESLRPVIDISANLCGQCHTGSHHPNFDEWSESGHADVTEGVDEELIVGGSFVNTCGPCHSGTVRYKSVILTETVPENEFEGQEPEDLIAITCAICHNPHQRTGNATDPGDGRDFQLRYPETAYPTPTNTIEAATDPTRFNICGQCHHSRGRNWTSTSRGPHGSVQSNVYVGEMATPDTGDEAGEPLVPSMVHKHIEAREQCATCHMYRKDFGSEQAPAIAGHTFQVTFEGCMTTGCHSTGIESRLETFQANVQERLDEIEDRLGDPATWEYSSEGGPMDQSTISDNVKKIRFLLKYVEADGSRGVHNPDYVLSMLDEAERLLDVEGL